MSATEYTQRHPLAWTLIAVVALAGIASAGAIQGWLPVPGVGPGPQAASCADCAIVESVSSDPFHHEVTVRYEDGSTGVFSLAEPPAWKAGDQVRVEDGIRLVDG
ncbi:MAG TPA: hypothetical protein VFR29_11460 [Steroidobacteraceae bacterium]|nr:hypothetical protein [Steroidobacteraceae bacterium]